jgi:NADH-quinone oxidoreductase subunit N
MKYFLLGSFAAAVLLYGGALLYGATGHTDLAGIGQSISSGTATLPLVVVGLMLVLVGLVFKVSAVPFHMWTPDAYEGAPTPATTFMAVAVKSAAFATMLRVLLISFGDPDSASWGAGWPPIVAGLAVLTMTVANLIAGRQESVKRMLAYSSIAHAGYLLIGVVATIRQNGHEAEGAVLFYLLTYTVSTAGAFGALILCGRKGAEATSYEDLAGVGRRNPGAALAFSLFLLSLAGIPPTAGFFGKFYIFRAAIYGGGGLYWLAVIGLLNSVIGAYYYLRVIVYMYMREPEGEGLSVAPSLAGGLALTIALVGLVLLGLMPAPFADLAQAAVTPLLR